MAEPMKEESTASGAEADAASANEESELEDLEWSADQEVLLLYSLNGYKPVGRDKHFHMLIIQDRLSNSMRKNISSKAIWKKLNSWYDLEALDEAEAEADAVDAVIVDFTLPEDEFGTLMNDKIKVPVIKVEKIQIEPESLIEAAVVQIKEEPPEEEEETNVRRMNRSKTATPVKEQAVALKKEKETPKKEVAGKKEMVKETRKIGKEDEKRDNKKAAQEVKKDAAKEEKKEPAARASKRDSTDKKTDKKDEKEAKKEVKKTEPTKTPKHIKEVVKQTKTKGETPPKPQKAEGKKDVAEKKSVEKKVEGKADKVTERPRTRGGEKKEEPEKAETPVATGTKRERTRDSSGSLDEVVGKKMKGRTRNSAEHTPTPPSPPRRRTRVT